MTASEAMRRAAGVKVNSAGKIIAQNPRLEDVELAMHDGTIGFCRACGHEQYGCEPDARRYTCENCGLDHVYGAEEFVMNGWVI